MSNLGMFMRRYFVAFGFAAMATGGLLMLMEQLIRPDFAEVVAQPPPPKINFDRHIVEPPPDEVTELPEPPPKVEPPPLLALVPTSDMDGPSVGVEFEQPGPGSTVIKPGFDQASGGLMQIVQVTPNYPERARRTGTQGYVVVEFTVDTTGAVRDARVIESHPSGIFDRAALISVERSKYKPRVEDGKGLVVHGVRKRVSFTLEI